MPESSSKSKSQATYLSDEYRNSLGRLLDLTDDQMEKLKKRIFKEIAAWKSDTSQLQQKLRRANDLIEGVIEETDYPFVGCSNIHIPIAAINMKVFHSFTRRSLLGTDSIWYMETDDDALRDKLPEIEENLNYKASSKWNISESISDVLWTTPRDSLGIIEVEQVEEYEPNVKDFVLVANDAEFLQEFPQEDPGMSDEEWASWRQRVATEASDENPLEIPFTYDREVYKGPKAEIVELSDFCIFPATAVDIGPEHCRGYGKRFYMRRGAIKKKKDEGLWYADAVDKFLQKTRRGSQVTPYMRSKDQIEGLNRGSKSDDYELFSLTYRYNFGNKEGEKKIRLVVSHEHKEILFAIDYPYRMDNYALFRIEKRANRLLGTSIPMDLDDLNEEIDTMHNQRINSRKIAEVPSFKGKKDKKKDFDAGADENMWRPGVIFWLEDPLAFDQFKVQPVDLSGSMAEEVNSMNIISYMMGFRPDVLSGAPPRENPKASGQKTAMLLQQVSMRMDDPLSELRHGLEKVGEICLSHEYQFGPAQISYSSDKQTKTFPKRLLRKGLTVRAHGTTVQMNPEAEFTKWFNYYRAFIQDPIIGNRTKSRWELLMRAMKAGRVQGREKILPTLQELEQEEAQMRAKVEMQKAIMVNQQKQAAMQKQAKAQQSQSDSKKKQVMGALKDHVAKRGLALKVAEQNGKARELAMNGNGNAPD